MKTVNGIEMVTLDVDGPTWGVIQAGLNELPRRISEPVLQALSRQIVAQTQPSVDPPKQPEGAQVIPPANADAQ